MMTIGWVRMMSITASPPKLPEMVGANDRVFVTTPHIVYTRLELNDIVDMRLILNRPVHTATNATQRDILSLELPLANCSNATIMRSGSKRPSGR